MSPDSLLSPGDAPPIDVYHAGSLSAAMADLAREVRAAYGVDVETHGGPSVGLANGVRNGKLQADVFASADAQVIESVLMSDADGAGVQPE